MPKLYTVCRFFSVDEQKHELNTDVNFLQGTSDTSTHYGFERQLSKHYTKAVYADFKKKMKKSTLFDIKEDPELLVPNYLVTYRNPEKTFSWSHHDFKVKADAQTGIFTDRKSVV